MSTSIWNHPSVIQLFFDTVLKHQIHLNSTEKSLDEKWSEVMDMLEANPLLTNRKFSRSRPEKLHALYMRMRRRIEKEILENPTDSPLELSLRRIYDEVKEDRSIHPHVYKGIKPLIELPLPLKKRMVGDIPEPSPTALEQTKGCLVTYNPELYREIYKRIDDLLLKGSITEQDACKAIEIACDKQYLTKMEELPPGLLALYIKNVKTH